VLEKDLAKKERKDQAKAEREEAKLAASKVTIKRIERTKRKFVTGVHGLEYFGKPLGLGGAFCHSPTRFAATDARLACWL